MSKNGALAAFGTKFNRAGRDIHVHKFFHSICNFEALSLHKCRRFDNNTAALICALSTELGKGTDSGIWRCERIRVEFFSLSNIQTSTDCVIEKQGHECVSISSNVMIVG